jgi:hypothetical protein
MQQNVLIPKDFLSPSSKKIYVIFPFSSIRNMMEIIIVSITLEKPIFMSSLLPE